jgi:hypothetical protein
MWQPRPKTAKQRYCVSKRTVDRWEDDPRLGFPKPLIRNGRKYDNTLALDEWDAACAAVGRSTRTPPAAGTLK